MDKSKKRKRGRPRKHPKQKTEKKRKRGRPRKYPKKRGRKRKRGRPKKTSSRKIKRAKPKKMKAKQRAVRKIEGSGEPIKKIKIALIGIGGGGGAVVSEIAQKIKGVSFYAANTDLKALDAVSGKVKKFHFGEQVTHGLGTGMNPLLGEESARNAKDRIKEMLEGQDLVILVGCLGGGVGSGAAPAIARISKGMNNLTYGIFTLPFKFEGSQKMDIAKQSLEKLKTELNAFSIIPNERIFQIIDRSAPLKKALSAMNKHLTSSIESLIEIIHKPGVINIDFADLKTIFNGKGRLTYLNSMDLGKDEDKDALDRVINYPIYPYGINGAKGVLFNISGKKDLSLLQVNYISESISRLANRDAKIIFGVTRDNKSSGIKISILATGCNGSDYFGKAKAKKKKKVVEKEKKPKKSVKKKRKKVRIKVEKARLMPSPYASPAGTEDKESKVRKNALQIKKEMEDEEAQIISKEKLWETPAFLRRNTKQD